MKTSTTCVRWGLALALLLPLMSAHAQYRLTHSVVASGGGQAEAAGTRLQPTLGQPTTGTATAQAYRLSSGFWRSQASSPSAPPSTIAVQIDNDYRPLDPVTVAVAMGDIAGGQPLENLYGVGFKLHYDPARFTATDGSLLVDGFFGDGDAPLTVEEIDAIQGIVSLSVTRTNGTGISGEGPILSFGFTIPDGAVPGTATFTLSQLLAIDASGAAIPLTATDGITYISGVWPGDTDQSCRVEAADLLPIGVAFDQTGPVRSGELDLTWGAKTARLGGWATPTQAYADATGDGAINQNDSLPIGLNYQKRRETPECPSPPSAPALAGKGADASPMPNVRVTLDPAPIGTQIVLAINTATALTDVLGLAFQLPLPVDVLRVTAVRAGSLLEDGDLLSFDRYHEASGLLDAAFTRKGTRAPASGTGTLVEIDVDVIDTLAAALTLDLHAVTLSFSNGDVSTDLGRVVLAQATSVGTEAQPGAVPETFALHGAYPNPFNPSTTLQFDLPEAADVNLFVYDLVGRRVAHLDAGTLAAGANHRLRFDAQHLASGLYLYRLTARMGSGVQMQTGRFVLLK